MSALIPINANACSCSPPHPPFRVSTQLPCSISTPPPIVWWLRRSASTTARSLPHALLRYRTTSHATYYTISHASHATARYLTLLSTARRHHRTLCYTAPRCRASFSVCIPPAILRFLEQVQNANPWKAVGISEFSPEEVQRLNATIQLDWKLYASLQEHRTPLSHDTT